MAAHWNYIERMERYSMKNTLFQIDNKILQLSEQAMKLCSRQMQQIEEMQDYNQQKMLYAF